MKDALDKKAIAAHRLADPVWLREQIQKLIKDCDDNIKEDKENAEMASTFKMGVYEARVESHEHWKRQLERILRGRTFAEDLEEGIKRGARRG